MSSASAAQRDLPEFEQLLGRLKAGGVAERTRQDIIDLLGRAAVQAQHAEAYHEAAVDPGALKGQSAQQTASDACAMQLIELAGCAEGFVRDRGEPGTTLARFDDALRPVIRTRNAHTHPEDAFAPPAVTPRRLGEMIDRLRVAIGNLDSETLKLEAPDQVAALNRIYGGLSRIAGDGLPNPAALRPRDLYYAGYYREIQFGRLAKATGLFDNWRSPDPRRIDVNNSIFDADDFAHKFHDLRGGADKSVLPISVVSAEHRNRVPGRQLSDLVRELRHEFQTYAERLSELALAASAKARGEYREAVNGLARQYAGIVEDAQAAALIHDYVRRRDPPLDAETIDAMRRALRAAADPGGDYLAAPETVRNHCLELCFALERQGDGRLINFLDAAEARSRVNVRKPGGIAAEASPSANQDKSPSKQPGFSRWTGEPLGETADLTQITGRGQKP
jgi:hypothetical protein